VADRLPHVMDRVGIWPAETSAAGSRTFLATVTSAARSCASSGVTLRAYETPSCASSRIGTAEARHEASWAAAHSATLRRGAARLGPALARGGPSGRPGSGTASPRDVSTAASEGLITRTGHLVPRSTRLTTLPTPPWRSRPTARGHDDHVRSDQGGGLGDGRGRRPRPHSGADFESTLASGALSHLRQVLFGLLRCCSMLNQTVRRGCWSLQHAQ
jgi:hypothetical protein